MKIRAGDSSFFNLSSRLSRCPSRSAHTARASIIASTSNSCVLTTDGVLKGAYPCPPLVGGGDQYAGCCQTGEMGGWGVGKAGEAEIP